MYVYLGLCERYPADTYVCFRGTRYFHFGHIGSRGVRGFIGDLLWKPTFFYIWQCVRSLVKLISRTFLQWKEEDTHHTKFSITGNTQKVFFLFFRFWTKVVLSRHPVAKGRVGSCPTFFQNSGPPPSSSVCVRPMPIPCMASFPFSEREE